MNYSFNKPPEAAPIYAWTIDQEAIEIVESVFVDGGTLKDVNEAVYASMVLRGAPAHAVGDYTAQAETHFLNMLFNSQEQGKI